MIALLLSIVLAQPGDPYARERLEGWELVVEKRVRGEAKWPGVKRELGNQLYRISRVVPDGPLGELRKVPIWIHVESPETKCMAYHPGADWLREHKMPEKMAKAIEIGNLKAFLSWTYEQPWMVLHELAHAYHDRVLGGGFENPSVKAAFAGAMAAKRYDSVRHWNGSMAKHYACTNPMEYFAEATEAYFGQNDFFPFTNAELKNHDPEGFGAMVSIWGKPQKRG